MQTIQATTITVKTNNGDITVAAVYCPPSQRLGEPDLHRFFSNLGDPCIVDGDWNAKNLRWGSRLISPRGKILDKVVDNLQYQVLTTDRPTYWLTDTDLLDFVVYKGLTNAYLDINECLDASESHSPIIPPYSTIVIKKKKNPTLYNKNIDWNSFHTCWKVT